jgi:prolyl oligopeptidase
VLAANAFRFDTSPHTGEVCLLGVTTIDAPLGRVVEVDLARPGVANWTTVVPETDSVRQGFAVVAGEILSVAQSLGIDRLERHDRATGELLGVVDGLGLVTLGQPVTDRVDDPEAAFFHVSGFNSPTELWRWSPADGVSPWLTSTGPLPDLQVSYHRYPSLDGTPVGLFVIHRRDVAPSPETPTLLNGYGGFAIAESPIFSPLVVAWCEAGGVYALAGLRGGYEEGEAWHKAGRRENKHNVFDDFHAAGDWLVDRGMTSRTRLGIFGGSNGGLLVGVALTQRPDAYRAVWCAVPLLDMIRYPQFLIARLWTDEYGDPDIAEEFAWLYAYSPYHHVESGRRYPAVLLTTAEGDSRVDPLHARKMAALLQFEASDADDRPVLLFQDGRAGHGVGKPVAKRADEVADVLSFFAWQLGLTPIERAH